MYDPITAAEEHYWKIEERKDAEYERAYHFLFGEMSEALSTAPMSIVSCPATPGQRYTAADVIASEINEEKAAEIIKIISLAAESADPLLRLSAQAWIAKQAEAHAKYHAMDYAEL